MLWINGGGFVMGDSEIDEDNNVAIVRDTGVAVAAVNYRLAPGIPSRADRGLLYGSTLAARRGKRTRRAS